jgi:DNA-binding transcriptional LysR family regulator
MLSLESIRVVDAIARNGSFSAAAAALGKVPSALTYTVRQLEAELDVLLFDRRGRGATLTPAGLELLQQGRQLLLAAGQISARVKRVAGGWETLLRIAVNGIVDFHRLRPLIEDFREASPTTRLAFSHEVLSGCWEAVTDDRADLVIGATGEGTPLAVSASSIGTAPMGPIRFVYCVAPHHPLARAAEPVAPELLQQYCAITLADTVRRMQAHSAGLLAGQPTISVATLDQKIMLQIAGTGVGFLPEVIARRYLDDGRLLARAVAINGPDQQVYFAWRRQNPGKGLQWWLERLALPIVQRRLMQDDSEPHQAQRTAAARGTGRTTGRTTGRNTERSTGWVR